MRVETLLPLGKLDPGLRAAETPLDLGRVVEDARLVESLGYDGLAVEETEVDPYVVLMCRFVGEVADGLRPNPVCTPCYIRDVMLPAMRAGPIAAGRRPELSPPRSGSSTGRFRPKACWRRSPALSRLPRHGPSATAS
jgi:hypothetical protein